MDPETEALRRAVERGLIRDNHTRLCILRDALKESIAELRQLAIEIAVRLKRGALELSMVEEAIAQLSQG